MREECEACVDFCSGKLCCIHSILCCGGMEEGMKAPAQSDLREIGRIETTVEPERERKSAMSEEFRSIMSGSWWNEGKCPLISNSKPKSCVELSTFCTRLNIVNTSRAFPPKIGRELRLGRSDFCNCDHKSVIIARRERRRFLRASEDASRKV